MLELPNSIGSSRDDDHSTFSSLPSGSCTATRRHAVEEQCGVSFSSIEDIMPCTPLQETLLAATMKRPGLYTQRRTFQVRKDVELARFQQSWDALVLSTPILRTRMVYIDGEALSLAVLREKMDWIYCDSLEDYASAASQRKVELGGRLTWVALVKRPEDGEHDLIWTMHHSLYDAWSFSLMLGHLENFYSPNVNYEDPLSFTDFIRHMTHSGSESSLQFWRNQLHEAACQHFPAVPSSYDPSPDTIKTYLLNDVKWGEISWSKDILIRAALALLMACHTEQEDVVFGVVSAGRKAPVQGIERMVFPTLATMPLRIRIDRHITLGAFLQQLRDQRRSMYAHEHTGSQHIRRLGSGEAHCCLFQTLLVVQAGQESDAESSLLTPADGPNRRADRLLDFASSALTFECEPNATGLVVHASFDAGVVAPKAAERLCRQLGHILQALCELGRNASEVLLADITMLGRHDLANIWHWNPPPPLLEDRLLHEVVLGTVAASPNTPAVHAWDGVFTYHELDELSNQIADILITAGIGHGSVVTICSQKSKWIPIAILGVLRSGACFATIEFSAPARRAASILSKTGATFLLTASPDSLPELPDDIVCYDLRNLPISGPPPTHGRSTNISPSDPAYICFTSGSTGEPKGIVVQHGAASTNLSANADVYNISPTTRTLSYSSLAFDASMFEVFCTLFRGGCLCIPSEEENMIDRLPEFISQGGVNTAFLTPAVLRQYCPADLPTMETLICGGEAVGEDLARMWAGKVNFFSGYGPTETIVMSVAHRVKPDDKGPPAIGRGIAANTWVVDPNDHNVLQMVGAVGELLIEGGTLAKGYLDDPERTAASFLENPHWLLQGNADGMGGRCGRVYKTGDLVRYREDGSLDFCGRADTQVKIRGQRVELAEIEVLARHSIPTDLIKAIAVEYTPVKDGSSNILLAFVVPADEALVNEDVARKAVEHAYRGLTQRLSSYMIPTHLMLIKNIPTTVSGKVDRKKLQKLAKSTALADMHAMSSATSSTAGGDNRKPSTVMELKMQELWASVVGREPEGITTEHTFLELGGDSILAMRLVGLARQHGIQLRTSDILQQQNLAEVARNAVRMDSTGSGVREISPFSLLEQVSNGHAVLKGELAELCSVQPSSILDAYPCTPFQERVMTLGASIRDSLVAHFIHRLDPAVDLEALRWAIDAESSANPLLRTRIVQSGEVDSLQVVVDTFTPCLRFPTSDAFAESVPLRHVEFGTPLTSISVIDSDPSGIAYMALIAHHAVFDGWSISLLLDRICTAYRLQKSSSPPSPPQFQKYIRYLMEIDKDTDKHFWEAQLKGCSGRCFPTVPETVKVLDVSSVVIHKIDNITWPSQNTPAANVRATLAILYAAFSDTSEALFCEAFTGRSTPVAGVESMTGPTLGTVPMRIILDPQETIQSLVDRMARQAMEVSLHAHCSRAQIREFNDDTNRGCDFTSFVIIQPGKSTERDAGEVERVIKERVVLDGIGGRQPLHLNPFLLEIDLLPGGLKLTLRSDERVLSGSRCEEFGRQFERVLRLIVEPGNRSVRQRDLDTSWLHG